MLWKSKLDMWDFIVPGQSPRHVTLLQRTEAKAVENGFLYCYVTLHEKPYEHAHSLREFIIYFSLHVYIKYITFFFIYWNSEFNIRDFRRCCWQKNQYKKIFFIFSFQSYILDASRRSSVMRLSSSPISGYFCIILAPTVTPAWLWKSQAASLIATCYARASTKAKKKKKSLIRPDFGRSYRHLSFSNSQWKTGHSTSLYYI